MKKIVWIILLVMLSPLAVHAEVVYSSYSDLIETEDKKESSDLMKVNPVDKYRFYQEYRIYDNNYTSLDQIQDEYPFIDESQWIWSPFSSWQREEVLEDEQTKIEIRKRNQYRKLKPVRQLKLTLNEAKEEFLIKELRVFEGSREVSFTVEEKIFSQTKLVKGESIILSFSHFCDLSQLNVLLQFINPIVGRSEYQYEITVPEEEEYLQLIDSFISHSTGVTPIYRRSFLKEGIKKAIYEEEITITEEQPDIYDLDLGQIKEYRYAKKQYKTYKIEKKYLEGYHVTMMNAIKDEESKKTFYQYQVRNYIDFFDQLTFFDPFVDVASLVKSSSYPLQSCKITTTKLQNTSWYQAHLDCQGDVFLRIYEVISFPNKNISSSLEKVEEKTPIVENYDEKEEKKDENGTPIIKEEEKDWGKPLKKKNSSLVIDYPLVIELIFILLGISFIMLGIKKYVDQKK